MGYLPNLTPTSASISAMLPAFNFMIDSDAQFDVAEVALLLGRRDHT
jgi:hypothetical protein